MPSVCILSPGITIYCINPYIKGDAVKAMLGYVVDFINTYIFGPGLCVAVFVSGIFLIVFLRPFFLTKPGKIMSALRSTSDSGIPPFRAMCVALAGTLGVGNIAGVASAIAIGGSGAVLWMLISALAALPIKYAETVLAMRHRHTDRDGSFHGGAFYYIEDIPSKISKPLAVIFAALCVLASFAMGCAAQSGAIAASAESSFGISPIICGSVAAALTFFIASGGLGRIAFLTDKLIPAMSAIYILMTLYIIISNASLLPDVISDIVKSSFNAPAACGGFVGFITSKTVRLGVTRGIISNEAGCGTAPIAHSSASGTCPAAQGVFGMLEVFIDTVVICTLTALSVLIAERHGISLNTDGMITAGDTFGMFIPFSRQILCISVAVFAFCTVICWFYYGTESLRYLTKKPFAHRIYLLLYSMSALYGAVASSSLVWSLSDLAISAMCALNTAVVLIYAPEIKKETFDYFYRKK